MRQLSLSLTIIENWKKKKKSNAHLDSGDLDPSRVPPLASPSLDAHRSKAYQAHRPVALA
jgi:hypothetical protein